ncbi:MAG: transposase [Clostridia bacterium]|nr:transposase [Clostridia bacterium]
MFLAVLYILKTGCQWRNLPKDSPNWKNIFFYLIYLFRFLVNFILIKGS